MANNLPQALQNQFYNQQNGSSSTKHIKAIGQIN
jgi:hypothetical protein